MPLATSKSRLSHETTKRYFQNMILLGCISILCFIKKHCKSNYLINYNNFWFLFFPIPSCPFIMILHVFAGSRTLSASSDDTNPTWRHQPNMTCEDWKLTQGQHIQAVQNAGCSYIQAVPKRTSHIYTKHSKISEPRWRNPTQRNRTGEDVSNPWIHRNGIQTVAWSHRDVVGESDDVLGGNC